MGGPHPFAGPPGGHPRHLRFFHRGGPPGGGPPRPGFGAPRFRIGPPPAFASHEEDRKGSITEGKLADLVVLSRDILSVPPEAIRGTRVDMTILGARVVHTSAPE